MSDLPCVGDCSTTDQRLIVYCTDEGEFIPPSWVGKNIGGRHDKPGFVSSQRSLRVFFLRPRGFRPRLKGYQIQMRRMDPDTDWVDLPPDSIESEVADRVCIRVKGEKQGTYLRFRARAHYHYSAAAVW